MKYRGFVFDLDGTLVDSALDFALIRKDLGIDSQAPILETVANWPEDQRRKANAIIHRHELTGAEVSILIQGVEEFLNVLKSHDIPFAIFTRNSRTVTLATVEKHPVLKTTLITRDDGPPKPDPHGLKKIARDWNFAPHEILFVGDYLYDLQAGVAAGVPTALYLNQEPDFNTDSAVFCFRDYSELYELVTRSP